jgi:hypothetical protein
VLARMHHHLVMRSAQQRRHRRCLDELRPVTDDRQNSQLSSSDWIRALIRAAA